MGKYLNAPHMCATLKVIMQTNKLQQQLLNTLACIHIKLLHSHHNSHTNFAKILIFTLAFTYIHSYIHMYIHVCAYGYLPPYLWQTRLAIKNYKKNQKCNIIQLFSLCKALLVGLFGCVGFVYKSLRTLFVKNNSYMLIRGKWLQRDIKSKNIYYLSTLFMCK